MGAACGGSGGLEKQLDTAASWRATMLLAAAEHRSGAITTKYSAELADAARQASAELHRTMTSAERDSSEVRRVASSLDSLDRAIQVLQAEAGR